MNNGKTNRYTKLKDLRINESRDLQGKHANKRITRSKKGFVIQCYQTKHKRNLTKSSLIPYEDFIYIRNETDFLKIKNTNN